MNISLDILTEVALVERLLERHAPAIGDDLEPSIARAEQNVAEMGLDVDLELLRIGPELTGGRRLQAARKMLRVMKL